MTLGDFVWPLAFVAIGAFAALWFGWSLHPFWCPHWKTLTESERELFRTRLDLIEANAEIKGMRASRVPPGKEGT